MGSNPQSPAPDPFRIETCRKVLPPIFVDTLLQHKMAAAQANCSIGAIDVTTLQRIVAAVEALRNTGTSPDQLPSLWQSGCGLESNRWANQCIAQSCDAPPLASISPETVNRNQSTNDTIPTVTHLSLLRAYHGQLHPACVRLQHTLRERGQADQSALIMGRTYLRDAKPMYVAEVFDAWSDLLQEHDLWLAEACNRLTWLPQGGYSLGNRDGADERFAPAYIQHLQTLLKPFVFRVHPSPSNAIAGIRALAGLAGALAALASGLEKIANDILLLCSGPEHGFGDLDFSSSGDDSTTLTGKRNPREATTLMMASVYARTQCTMVLDLAARGQLQLYTAFPITAHALLESMDVATGQISAFTQFVSGLMPTKKEIKR